MGAGCEVCGCNVSCREVSCREVWSFGFRVWHQERGDFAPGLRVPRLRLVRRRGATPAPDVSRSKTRPDQTSEISARGPRVSLHACAAMLLGDVDTALLSSFSASPSDKQSPDIHAKPTDAPRWSGDAASTCWRVGRRVRIRTGQRNQASYARGGGNASKGRAEFRNVITCVHTVCMCACQNRKFAAPKSGLDSPGRPRRRRPCPLWPRGALPGRTSRLDLRPHTPPRPCRWTGETGMPRARGATARHRAARWRTCAPPRASKDPAGSGRWPTGSPRRAPSSVTVCSFAQRGRARGRQPLRRMDPRRSLM